MTEGAPRETFRVPVENLDRLRERVAKLARRAERLRVAPVELELVGGVEADRIEHKDAAGVVRVEIRRYQHVRVAGPAPKIGGWTFIAVLQHLEGANLLRHVPGALLEGEGIPNGYRNAEAACDHCQLDRRRHDTFVLRSDAGEWKQVGRTCLRDFLGHASPEALAALAELRIALAEACGAAESWGGGGGRLLTTLESYTAVVAALIRVDGWTSRAAARDRVVPGPQATADAALRWCDPPRLLTSREREWRDARAATDADRATADAAIEWARGLAGASDYEHNLRVVASLEAIEPRQAGIAAAVVSGYLRHLGEELRRQRSAATSRHFGVVGERGEFQVSVERKIALDNAWGTTLLKFLDAEGNVAVWFASRSADFAPGRTYRVKATVKRHDAREGVAQTVLTRVVLVEVLPALPAPEPPSEPPSEPPGAPDEAEVRP